MAISRLEHNFFSGMISTVAQLLIVFVSIQGLVASLSPGLKGFCFAGSDALCSCDELIRRGFIYSYADCTLAVQVVYCQEYGPCWYRTSHAMGDLGTSTLNRLGSPTSDGECFAGSEALCSCSELIKRKAIDTFDDCTQESAIDYCKSNGPCENMVKLALE